MSSELVPTEQATPAPYADPLADRMRAQMDLIKAQIMPPMVDAQGKVTGPATDDETALAIAQAAARGVDLLANQGRLVRNKQGVVELWRTWEGLVVVAQRTGEYGGIEATLYTDGRKQAAQNRWGKIVEQYVWQDAWDSDEAPVACTVGIWRKGADRPSWGIAHYSTWGTEPDPEGWSDKIVNGKRVMNRWNKPVRIHNGVRVPKASEWWKMPKAIHQLAIAALRNALKAEFQPDTLRKATMAAAKGMTRDERLEAASEIVGRDVDTFNDLDPSEYAEVYDEFVGRSDYDTAREDTEAAPDSGPAAGPLAPEHAGPANISAGTGRAQPTAVPAEHHSDEELGEVPSPEGLGGGVAVMSDAPPSGPAPAPTRQRRKTDPGGAPSVAQVQAHQKTAEQTRKQETVDRGPTRWRFTIPQPQLGQLTTMFHGKVNDLEEFLRTFAEQEPDVPALTEWTDRHWPDTKLAVLMEAARVETSLSR